jgi:DNA-directed RNA polymerase subunit beta
MAQAKKSKGIELNYQKKRVRVDLGSKGSEAMKPPFLLLTQLESYRKFLQAGSAVDARENQGLHAAFQSVFPITSFTGHMSLEYVGYILGDPLFDETECKMRGLTYGAPLRVKMRLSIRDKDADADAPVKDIREQEVYMGEMPLMTDTGSLIING